MRSSRRGAAAGLLAVALSAGPALGQPAGNAAKGAEAFDERCSQCHTIGGVSQGPDLAGVVGRRAGASPEFPYTPALKAARVTWTPANLERFIANPQAMIPGSAMTVIVPSAAERADIVAYLASQKGR